VAGGRRVGKVREGEKTSAEGRKAMLPHDRRKKGGVGEKGELRGLRGASIAKGCRVKGPVILGCAPDEKRLIESVIERKKRNRK